MREQSSPLHPPPPTPNVQSPCMRKSSSGRSAYSAPGGPGGLLFPGAHQKCRAGKRWLTSDGGDTAPPALKNPAASLAPKVPERGRVSQPPQHRRFLGFGCSPSRRRRTSATDGDPAGCVPVPKAVQQAMAAAWAGPRRRRRQPCWPELTMQAVHGQIPSLTGLQQTVITTVSGAAAEATPYYTGKGAGGRAQQGLLKRQQDKCRRGRLMMPQSMASELRVLCQRSPLHSPRLPSEGSSTMASETWTPWGSPLLEHRECRFLSGKKDG